MNSNKSVQKICYYSVATNLGGAERSLLDLVTQLHADPSYEPWILLPKGSGPLVDELKVRGIAYEALPMPELFLRTSRSRPWSSLLYLCANLPHLFFYFFNLLAIIRTKKPDIIHTTGIKCHLIGSVIGAWLKTPAVLHMRDILAPGWTQKIIALLSRLNYCYPIANSKATALSMLPNQSMNIPVIFNGISVPQDPAPTPRLRQELGLNSETRLIGILGVLARWKGQVEFIQMAQKLCDQGVDAHFAIIGEEIYDTDGDQGYKAQLIALIKRLGLQKRVHLLGFRKDVPEVLASLDILVHASILPEPFGRVLIEAMAQKIPVCASQAGGVLEILTQNPPTGLLHHPGDPEHMAKNVLSLMDHPEQSKSISDRAYQRFQEIFTLDAHIASMREVYRMIPKDGRRVGFVIHDLNTWGGQDRSVLGIAKHMSHHHPVDLYSISLSDPDFPKRWGRFARWRRIKPVLARPVLIKVIMFILGVLKEVKIKKWINGNPILHATGAISLTNQWIQVQFVQTEWARLQKKAVGASKKGVRIPYHWVLSQFNRGLEKWLYTRPSTQFIAIADVVRQELKQHFGIEDSRITTIHHGVNPQEFRPADSAPASLELRRQIRQQYSIGDQIEVALFCGVYDRKGLHTVMEAVSKLDPSTRKNLKVLAVGNGDHPYYTHLAQKLEISDHILLVGHVKDVYPYYAASDFFVLPTQYEPFGLVILEAISCGLVPIVSKTAGASELVTHLQNGFILEDPKDATSLSQHFEHYLNLNLQKKMELKARCRELAFQHTWEQVSMKYLAALTQSHSDERYIVPIRNNYSCVHEGNRPPPTHAKIPTQGNQTKQ